MIALLLPTLASAAELDLSLGAAVEYDSNVFRISDGSDRSKTDDVIFRIVPAATLYSDEGAFTYQLRYSVPFEQGVDSSSEVNDFDQLARVQLGYRISESTRFFFNNLTRYARSHSRPNQQDQGDELIPDVNNRRARVLRNRAELGMTHSFAPRLSGTLRLSHALFETNQNNRADNWTITGTANLNYLLTQKHTVGGGLSVSYQSFDDAPALPENESTFYNMFLSWVYRFDETTTLSLSGGPVVIVSNQDSPPDTVSDFPTYPFVVVEQSGGTPTVIGVSNFANCVPVPGQEGSLGYLSIVGGNDPGCGSLSSLGLLDSSNPAQLADFNTVLNSTTTLSFPSGTNPGSRDDTTVSGFGQVTLTKRWTPTVASEASYRRQQSTASGIGGSTILDGVSVSSSWQITELWDVAARFDWTKRESVSSDALQTSTAVVVSDDSLDTFNGVAAVNGVLTSEVPINNEVNTQRWGISLRLGRKITRNLDASLRLSYNEQDSKSRSRGNASDFDNYHAILGIRYSFNPMEIW